MRQTTCDMSTCFFCRHCPKEWLELTRLHKQTLQFKKGEVLFVEGSPTKGKYFINTGSVKVHKQWGPEKELIIRFASAGDMLGFRGFEKEAYRASATALEATEVCFIPNDHLEASLRMHASLSYNLMQVYATELQIAEQRMNDLAHRDVKGRVAEMLLMIQDRFGEDENQFLHISISRQDIASYAGTTYETVFKIFTDWTAQGWIRTEGKRICILQKESLQPFANH